MKKFTYFVRCPFVLASLSGIIALIGDLFWLIFDTIIKTTEFLEHPVAYSFIGTCLVTGIVLLIWALIRYKRSGLEGYERKIQLEYLQEVDRRKLFENFCRRNHGK